MSKHVIAIGAVAAFALSAGQQQVVAQLPTTVQLPSFSSFSYSGTVVVPVGGSTSLGGVSRSASGMNRRGLSRGFGSAASRSHATARVTIIDHNEMDRQLLGGTPKQFMARQQKARRDLTAKRKPTASDEGKALVRYARQKYREGNKGVAFDSYRMAIDILPPDLKRLAEVEFRRVFGAAATQANHLSVARR